MEHQRHAHSLEAPLPNQTRLRRELPHPSKNQQMEVEDRHDLRGVQGQSPWPCYTLLNTPPGRR